MLWYVCLIFLHIINTTVSSRASSPTTKTQHEIVLPFTYGDGSDGVYNIPSVIKMQNNGDLHVVEVIFTLQYLPRLCISRAVREYRRDFQNVVEIGFQSISDPTHFLNLPVSMGVPFVNNELVLENFDIFMTGARNSLLTRYVEKLLIVTVDEQGGLIVMNPGDVSEFVGRSTWRSAVMTSRASYNVDSDIALITRDNRPTKTSPPTSGARYQVTIDPSSRRTSLTSHFYSLFIQLLESCGTISTDNGREFVDLRPTIPEECLPIIQFRISLMDGGVFLLELNYMTYLSHTNTENRYKIEIGATARDGTISLGQDILRDVPILFDNSNNIIAFAVST